MYGAVCRDLGVIMAFNWKRFSKPMIMIVTVLGVLAVVLNLLAGQIIIAIVIGPLAAYFCWIYYKLYLIKK